MEHHDEGSLRLCYCKKLFTEVYDHVSYPWYMARSSTANMTVEEFCQHRKKKKSCPWLLKNRASHCWKIVPVTVEELCQGLLKNRASLCWIIVPVTVKQSCQWLLNNYASDYWITVPATVGQSCQWLLNNCVRDCWMIVPNIFKISKRAFSTQ